MVTALVPNVKFRSKGWNQFESKFQEFLMENAHLVGNPMDSSKEHLANVESFKSYISTPDFWPKKLPEVTKQSKPQSGKTSNPFIDDEAGQSTDQSSDESSELPENSQDREFLDDSTQVINLAATLGTEGLSPGNIIPGKRTRRPREPEYEDNVEQELEQPESSPSSPKLVKKRQVGRRTTSGFDDQGSNFEMTVPAVAALDKGKGPAKTTGHPFPGSSSRSLGIFGTLKDTSQRPTLSQPKKPNNPFVARRQNSNRDVSPPAHNTRRSPSVRSQGSSAYSVAGFRSKTQR
ncbi:hypothetical protein OIO90_006630 [Microbotryomycetes sp. JL221]|nr:hypothetical protein OIO90_006630 [Microbotryomycetes sp. JL221]